MNKSFKFLLSFVLLSWSFALNASIAQDTTRVKEQKQLQIQETHYSPDVYETPLLRQNDNVRRCPPLALDSGL